MSTYENRKTLPRRITAALLILMMVLALMPADSTYAAADSSYGFQPEGADNTQNSMMMLDVCGIESFSKLQQTADAYINEVKGTIDGTKSYKTDAAPGKEGIYFSFTMSAGMNNFQETWFRQKNMDQIKIYDKSGQKILAEYNNGNGDLEFWGSRKSEDINNHGSQKTVALYIGVRQGLLGTGEYLIRFGSGICGNNADKTLGKNIDFRFKIKAAPPLAEMIAQAQDFLNTAETGGLIHDSEPGKYPQAAVKKLKEAIEKAETVNGGSAGTAQKEQAAEELYDALEAFKDSMNFTIENIAIAGIESQINVGDTGIASAQVTVKPDDARYKQVIWSALKYSPGDSSGPASQTPAENLIIGAGSGSWNALYSGTVWIKAASLRNPKEYTCKKVEIRTEPGVLAVNLPDKGTRLETQVSKAAAQTGSSPASITALKVFTTGDGSLTAADIRYIKEKMTGLSSLNLKNARLQQLEQDAFRACRNLTAVELPDSLTAIGQRAFYNCSNLKKLEIPAGVTSLGGSAFAGCTALESTMVIHAVYPPSYATTGSAGDVFDGTQGDTPASVTAIKVPYSCKEDYKSKQGWRAFSITEGERQPLEVSFSRSGTLAQSAQAALQKRGLSDSDITDLTITSPEGVQMARSEDVTNYLQTHFLYATSIDLSGTAFEDNKCNSNTFKERISLKYIELPESTTTIGGTCFYGCKNLRQIRLPEALGNIGSGAFGGCDKAGSSVISGAVKPPSYDGQVFPDCTKNIIAPPQSIAAYQKAVGWRNYKILSQVSLSLSAKSMVLKPTEKKNLTATVKVYNHNNDTVTWSSSNTRVAKVSPERGKTTTVAAVKPGTAVITAKAANGHVKAACTVTVGTLPAPAAKAVSAGYNKAKISWGKVSNAQGYIIYRSTKKNSGYVQKRTLQASARSYTDTGLSTGKTYYYRVRAYKDEGNTRHLGAYSRILSVRPAVSAPAGVKAKQGGKQKAAISWKKAKGANGYTVYQSAKQKSGFKAARTINSTKFTTKKLKKGKRYYFKVRAYSKVGGKKVYGAYSKTVSYKVK